MIQANSLEQSLFWIHSGRHPWYGSPLGYSAIQEHWPLLQFALAPQGEGLQGSSNEGSFAKRLSDVKCEKVDGY